MILLPQSPKLLDYRHAPPQTPISQYFEKNLQSEASAYFSSQHIGKVEHFISDLDSHQSVIKI